MESNGREWTMDEGPDGEEIFVGEGEAAGGIWTRKTMLFMSAGVTSAVGGMIFNDPLALILAMVMVSALIFAFATTRSDVTVQRMVEENRTFEDEEVKVRLRVTNKGRALGMVDVYDKLPPTFRITSGENRGTFGLMPGESVDMEYTFACPLRGYYMLGPSVVRRGDIFSIFSEDRVLEHKTHMTVYPKVTPVRDVSLRSLYRKVHPGAITTRTIGHGTEFHSIRDYAPSDPFKRINWKVTARTRKLMVNQYDTDDVFDTMIFVDARDVTRVGTTLSNPLEVSIRAATALARTIMRRTNRVGLVTYGDGARILYPSSGEAHMSTILSTLTGTYARGSLTFKEALDMASPYITPRSPVILLSPLEGDETVREVAGYLSASHHHFTVISPSGIDFERSIEGGFTPRYLLVKLERENVLNELRNRGARVVDWTPDVSLERVVEEVV